MISKDYYNKIILYKLEFNKFKYEKISYGFFNQNYTLKL